MKNYKNNLNHLSSLKKRPQMITPWMNNLLVMVILAGLTCSYVSATKEFAISLPHVRPDHPEQYLCVAARLPVDLNAQYIVGIKPHGDSKKVHHMLLYGCPLSGVHQRDTPNLVWDCSGMHVTEVDAKADNSYRTGPICQGQPKILYGWALDAPALKLPKDVGFKVGGLDTGIHFLVVQVHYGHTHAFHQNPDLTDNSGLILELKPNSPESGITKQAGVMLLASFGLVERGKSRHEIYCDMKEDIEIHPFRFRGHTHKLGTEVLGAKLTRTPDLSKWQRNTLDGQFKIDHNSLIGRVDPQKPQMFYPVKERNMTIKKGDTIYAYCEFNNNKTHIVNIGQTGNDEMCNFYLMYWTDSPRLLSQSTCYAVNPNYLTMPYGFSSGW